MMKRMNFEYRSGCLKQLEITLYLRMILALSGKSAETAESAEKSAEKQEELLSERQLQILVLKHCELKHYLRI